MGLEVYMRAAGWKFARCGVEICKETDESYTQKTTHLFGCFDFYSEYCKIKKSDI